MKRDIKIYTDSHIKNMLANQLWPDEMESPPDDGYVTNEETEMAKTDNGYIQWMTRGDGVYYPESQVKLVKHIPPGYYNIRYDNQLHKYNLRKISYSTDKILDLPMEEKNQIVKDITTFWSREKEFKKYELTFKRGVLLYGTPGGGKSHIIQLIVNQLITKQKGVVFKLQSPDDVESFESFMQSTFKPIESTRKVVVIIEDIDGLFHTSKSTETCLLNILDGMGQMDQIVYLATTNYPEELAERIINRPSRFDRRYEIGLPNYEVRKSYFQQTLMKDDLKKIDMDRWVRESEGLSIAHLREIVVSTVIQGNSFEDTIKIMQTYNTERPSSKTFTGSKKVGFKL